MTISGFFFGRKQNASNGHCTSCGKLRCGTVRTRTLSMEPLETRDLLSVTTSLLDADDAANVAAVISSSASSDNLTVELPAADQTSLKSSYATPDGYNDNDYQKMVAFLEQTDSDGVKNGMKISENYDPTNPNSWSGITWNNGNGSNNRILAVAFGNKDLAGSADFSYMTDLKTFNCLNNNITSLNLSGAYSLEILTCQNNQLTSLNISGCKKIVITSIYNFRTGNTGNFNISNNPLEILDISGCTSIKQFGYNGTSSSSLSQLKVLNVSGCTGLTYLDSRYGQLTSLNVSGCTALTQLGCDNNQLISLDVSGCTVLASLNCAYNQLTLLDVSKNLALIQLNCNNNQLTALDVSENLALTKLNCSSNQLTSLDVSNHTSLTNLSCNYNQLTYLNVSGCTSLILSSNTNYYNSSNSYFQILNNPIEYLNISGCTGITTFNYSGSSSSSTPLKTLDVSDCATLVTLYCHSNQLTSLDVSGSTALTTLYCDNNKLTSLDLSNHASLTTLRCYNNQLKNLNVSNCTSLALTSSYNYFDSNSSNFQIYNNPIDHIDISGCTGITVFDYSEYSSSNTQLKSLNISGCTALTRLNCTSGQLTSLDVSSCTALTSLSCSSNQLTSLDVSSCTGLTSLSCGSNQLTSLDVSGCSSLNYLYCPNNQLTTLDASNCSEIILFECYHNQLTSLDLSNSSVINLYCYDNRLTSLDVSSCNTLARLTCSNNQLTSLDVSGCNDLETLVCSNNQLTSLDFSGCNALASLTCNNNQLTSLDVSGYSVLATLTCNNNQLASLNVSGCTALATLTCNNNQLTVLDLSTNTALVDLNCSVNQLPSLDVSNHTELITLKCSSNLLTVLNASGCIKLVNSYGRGNTIVSPLFNNNPLETINFSGCTSLRSFNYYGSAAVHTQLKLKTLDVSGCTSLTSVNCSYGQVSSLDVSDCTALLSIQCNNNQLSSLDLSDCTALASLQCNSNQLSSLDVSNNALLTTLNVSSNPLTQLELFANNQLASLRVGNNTDLSYVYLTTDQIGTLSVYFEDSWNIQNKSGETAKISNGNYSPTEIPFFAVNSSDNQTVVFASFSTPSIDLLSVNQSEIAAAWSAVDNALRYTLEYQLDGTDGWIAISDIQGTKTSFIGVPGNTYNIRVKANGYNNYSDSLYSEISSVFISIPLTGLTLSTDAPEVGTVITAYLAPSDASAEYQWYSGTTLIEGAADSSFTVTTAQIGQTITCIATGTGSYSGTVSASTSAVKSMPLDAPEISNLSNEDKIVTAAWSEITNASSYTIEYQLDVADSWTSISGICTASASFIGELGKTYNVRVKAVGTGNYSDSDYSETKNIKLLYVLDAPQLSNVTVTGLNVVAAWSAVGNASGYAIEYKLGDSDWSVLATTEETTASLIGQPGGEYSFRVKAVGTGVYADSVYSQTQTVTIDDTLDAQNDFVKTTLNSPVVIDYRENDDATDWSVVAVQFGNASHGECTVIENGSVTYSPENGFFGTDSVPYAIISPSGKMALGSITVSVGLPVATSVQKTSGSHTPSTAMAASVDSLTDWDNCYIELWAQGVTELGAGEATITLEYNPAVYAAPILSDCADGAALSVSQSVPLPNGNVQVELTVETSQTIASQTDNLYLGTVILTPSEDGAGAEDGADAPACALDGLELTTTVEAMPYDLVRNGAIDVNDFVAFATVFGTNLGTMSPENPLYAQAVKADFNNDGIINVDDFISFATNFGATKKSTAKPIPQASAADSGYRESKVENGEVIDSQVETPEFQPALPDAQSAASNSQLVTPDLQFEAESSMTLRESHSAALLDLYDNFDRADLSDVSNSLAESRREAPVADYSDGDSLQTLNFAIDAVLEKELLTIDWN